MSSSDFRGDLFGRGYDGGLVSALYRAHWPTVFTTSSRESGEF
jgi:hypothetical protein